MTTPAPQLYNLPSDAVWFITGCSSGMGQALAQHIATKTSPPQRVVATARNPASLAEIPDGPNVLKLPLDVTSYKSIDAAFDSAVAHFGRVDVVVNNAGYNLMGDAEASEPGNAGARTLIDTNFWGAVDVTKRALAIFRDTNPKTGQRGGVILNITSMGGFISSPGNSFYHASKYALEGFAESVAKEVLPEWNIHICNVEPGGVLTKYTTTSLKRMPRHPAYLEGPTTDLLKFMDDTETHKLFASPEQVAQAIYGVVGSGRRIPVRIPMGRDAWGIVMSEVERVKEELEEFKDVSCAMGDYKVEDMAKLVK
ncbi:NAD(P)-binding protein [Hypoxylon trugodes]|uniref:NAD(P)-binding protein n=1 Tax=Hypoxylon trugodes TaxID=326681 RepID=UPI002199E847|nr:NAD(P)-binding protein [Hypoxylon trugodes]KAI1388344.1 NAD(P)-binding protein [Hypoxylon trugodes]